MSDVLMTNIFFIITGISSVLITAVLIIALIYLIKLIKKVTAISEAIETETLQVMSDVEELRATVKSNMNFVKGMASATFLKNILKKIFTRSDRSDS